MIRIYNTLAREKQEFHPIRPGEVRMYVCGMTVYDYCHIGHARVMVVFDIVQRWLRTSGYAVTYVRNITDIEDKIIQRARDNGESIGDLTQRFTRFMQEDQSRLGVQSPDHEPRATDHVPAMLEMIGALERNGYAYRATDGDVNFSVRRSSGYGKLSGKSLEDLRAGERVEVSSAKQDPLDFVLWKRAREGDPFWPSDFGNGRHRLVRPRRGTLQGCDGRRFQHPRGLLRPLRTSLRGQSGTITAAGGIACRTGAFHRVARA